MDVLCFGFGFVGKAYALWLREQGHTVSVMTAKDHTWRDSIDYGFFEPLPWKELSYDAIVIAVPTPTVKNKQDISILENVLGRIRKTYRTRNIIIKSTVLPENIKVLEKKYKKNGQHFYLYPEFLEAKNPIGGVFNQTCMVFGKTGKWSADEKAFLSKLFNLPINDITFTTLETASMLKYVHNMWLSCNISFWNAIMRCSKDHNIDINTVLTETHKSKYFGPHPWSIGTAYGGACCHPLTPIVTLTGIIPIVDVKIGDLVLTHKGNFKKVKQLFNRDVNHIYKIRLQGQQPFFITNEHPVFAASAHRFKRKNGKLSNWNFSKKIIPEWINSENLQKGDFVFWKKPNHISNDIMIKWMKVIPHRGQRSKIMNDGMMINKNIMRLLGYYISEGCWDNERISWAFHIKEKEYHNDVISILKNEFNIDAKAKKRNNCMIIRASSNIFADWIKKMGGTNGSKRLHSDLLFAKEHLIAEFLKGYIRGDGSKSTDIYSCATISKELFYQLQVILLRLGIAYTISIRKEIIDKKGTHHKQSYTIRIRNYVDISNLNKWGIDKDGSQIHKSPKLLRKTSWVQDDYLISPIKSINKTDYVGKVYNLEVADDESYTTLGAALHNCLPKDIKAFVSSIKKGNKFKQFIEMIDSVNEEVIKNSMAKRKSP
jgi:UDP-glucose 6-dehydrogenase